MNFYIVSWRMNDRASISTQVHQTLQMYFHSHHVICVMDGTVFLNNYSGFPLLTELAFFSMLFSTLHDLTSSSLPTYFTHIHSPTTISKFTVHTYFCAFHSVCSLNVECFSHGNLTHCSGFRPNACFSVKSSPVVPVEFFFALLK